MSPLLNPLCPTLPRGAAHARRRQPKHRAGPVLGLILGALALLCPNFGPAGQEATTTQPEAGATQGGNKKRLTPLIDRIATQQGLEPALVHAVIAVESAYNIRAVSSKGALGLMQVLPTTAGDYGVEDRDRLFDPETNLTTGTKHLRRLLSRYRNLSHALMAYHAGEGEFSDFRREGIFAETRRYMIQIVETYWQLKGR